MVIRLKVVASFLVLLVGCGAPAQSDSAGPLEGAWQLTGIVNVAVDGTRTDDTPQESLFLFSGDHYSMAFAYGAPSPPYAALFTPTDEDGTAAQ